jgi:hypothetical protein
MHDGDHECLLVSSLYAVYGLPNGLWSGCPTNTAATVFTMDKGFNCMCHSATSGFDVHDSLRPTMCQPVLRDHDAPTYSVWLADYPV